MDRLLLRALKENTPEMNHQLVRGIAKGIFENIPAYLNEMIKISMEKIHPKIDFKYLGYKICSPEEELMEDAYSRASNKPADIAQNNVYLCKFKFMYNGQEMPKYIYLPYADPGNIFVISGTKYVVMSVITDLVISVKPDRIFVRLHRDKIHNTSERRRVILNDNPNPEMPKIIYSPILNSGAKDKMRPGGKTPIALYLLCKYGLKETLRRYTKLTPDDFLIKYDPYDKINIDSPEAKKYNIFATVGEKPKGYDRGLAYRQHKIKVLVNKKIPMDPFITNLIGAIIMSFDMANGAIEEDLGNVYDNIPKYKANLERLETKYQERIQDFPDDLPSDLIAARKKYYKEKELELTIWRLLLGRGMYKSDISVDKIKDDVDEHIIALDSYVDEIIKKKLSNVGIILEDFWDMLVYIINIYAEAVNNAKEYNRNVNNFYMDLYYYICYDIIIGFNRAVKQINQRYQKNGYKSPSRDEIKRIFNNDISEKVIYNLVKSSSASLALAQADIANDSLYYRATAQLENQNRGEGVRRGGKTNFPDSIKTLTGYMLLYGSLLFLIKSAPTPTLRANPWGQWDPETGHIIIPDHLKNTVEKLDAALRGITEATEEIKEALSSTIEDIKDEENIGKNTDEGEETDDTNDPDTDNSTDD